MTDQGLRDAIHAAMLTDPARHARVQEVLNASKRRSKDDIERSWELYADLQPKIPSDRIVWHTHTFGEVLPEQDIMATIRDSARG